MKKKAIIKYVIDGLLALGFLFMFNIRATGVTVHEVIGTVAGLVILVHIGLNWRWVVQITKKIFSKLPFKTRLSYVLNLLLLITAITFTVSGLAISKVVMPFFGLSLRELWGLPWKNLHIFTGELSLLLIGIHVGLHWKWIVSMTKRLVLREKTIPYGKQLRLVLLAIMIVVGGIGAGSTVLKVANQGMALVSGNNVGEGGFRGEGFDGGKQFNGERPSGDNMERPSEPPGEITQSDGNGENGFVAGEGVPGERGDFSREGGGFGREGRGFQLSSTLLLILQYSLILAAISFVTNWVERRFKKA